MSWNFFFLLVLKYMGLIFVLWLYCNVFLLAMYAGMDIYKMCIRRCCLFLDRWFAILSCVNLYTVYLDFVFIIFFVSQMVWYSCYDCVMCILLAIYVTWMFYGCLKDAVDFFLDHWFVILLRVMLYIFYLDFVFINFFIS